MQTDKTVTQLEPLDVLREMFQLVTDDILVRNIERDSLTGEYLRNASRLVMVLKRAETLLTKPTASVPTLTNDAELAELLNMLMATNVHGAILQLRDHLDGDKRLLDNYQRLYKSQRSIMKAIELLDECRLNLLNREHHERLLNDDDWQLIRKLDEFIADFRVDVPPVEQSDTVENVNNNRMLAGWGRYNYMECADKGSHDMRLAFIAGYKRALYWASQPSLSDMDEPTLK